MEEELYDEFGNYVGPALEEEEEATWQATAGGYGSDDDEDAADDAAAAADAASDDEGGAGTGGERRIVLHEDKKYYPGAEEVYPEAETLVEVEDTQALSEPIVRPVRVARHAEEEEAAHAFSAAFLRDLQATAALVRNVTLAGALHHGKTALADLLVRQTHERRWTRARAARFTDALASEQARGVSLKSAPLRLAVEDSNGKSHALGLLDTPGHVDFLDEAAAAMRLSDGLLLVVDAVEGPTLHTERLVRQAAVERLAVTLVVAKVDRLVVELRLPPAEAYYKLRHVVRETDRIVRRHLPGHARLSPPAGNVCFTAARHGWAFSLASFAAAYAGRHRDATSSALPFAPEDLARRLWGDVWWDSGLRRFVREAPDGGGTRSFVAFVLEPLYKLYSAALAEEAAGLARVLDALHVPHTPEMLRLGTQDLLRAVFGGFFGKASCLVDMAVAHVPAPNAPAATAAKLLAYTGGADDAMAEAVRACDPAGPLVAFVAKLYARADGGTFDAFARVLSGSVRVGQRIRVLGEAYSIDDEEDMVVREVTAAWIYQTRYRIAVDAAPAGTWVLLEGVDESISKTATLVAERWEDGGDVAVFKAPVPLDSRPVVKIAVEPLQPAELPRMLAGLRKVNKSYPLAVTRAEESGEHVVLGSGELYLDCLLHDLRKVYAEVEVKVADPVVSFCETVAETSSIKCFAESPNRQNKVTLIAEPLEARVAADIEAGVVALDQPARQVAAYFRDSAGWDVLEARSVWAFGPDANGANVLLDDTLPAEVDKAALSAVRASLVHGFQWGTREGPLCEEPIRGAKFRLLDASVAAEAIHRGGGQLIPTARRVTYSAFLTATPRLMEPVLLVELLAPEECIMAVYKVLARRRGHIAREEPRPGTPLFTVRAYLPAIESFGFETDLMCHTQGQVHCQAVFDHWELVPGDPLDASIALKPLQPAPTPHLARDFLVKTRRRKGLSEDINPKQFFDEEMRQYFDQAAAEFA